MNKLPLSTRTQILHMLVEGSSMRAIARVTGVSPNTVDKLLVDAGAVCAQFHDEKVRGLRSNLVECDEIWSFCYAKQKNIQAAKAAPEEAGDVWTWTAIDADSKLIISYLVGGRDAEYALEFTDDLRSRLDTRVQLTTDGYKVYLKAVEESFGSDVDYAQLVKMYGNAPDGGKGKYSPSECTGIKKIPVTGSPEYDKVSTSYVERQNLTMRMSMRRFTRLTNAFSKKIENHIHALSLYFVYYNFIRIHKTLKTTPAMQAGISAQLLDFKDIIDMIDAKETLKPRVRGSYKKKISN